MYVCICNGYRDGELRALAQQGVRHAQTAYQCLGNGPQCGRCLPRAQRLLDETQAPELPAGTPFIPAIGG
jgi:bacterioferritin-associated ferredoxin